MRMRPGYLRSILAVLAFLPTAAGARALEAGEAEAPLATLVGIAESAANDELVPGLAIVVVHRDRVLLVRGFGVR